MPARYELSETTAQRNTIPVSTSLSSPDALDAYQRDVVDGRLRSEQLDVDVPGDVEVATCLRHADQVVSAGHCNRVWINARNGGRRQPRDRAAVVGAVARDTHAVEGAGRPGGAQGADDEQRATEADSAPHSPNERYSLDHYHRGIEMLIRFMYPLQF